jgi:hypothetical protein
VSRGMTNEDLGHFAAADPIVRAIIMLLGKMDANALATLAALQVIREAATSEALRLGADRQMVAEAERAGRRIAETYADAIGEMSRAQKGPKQ